MDSKRLTAVRPHERQIRWQALGFTAFLHFGMNTFTNREWGTGRESPGTFAPAALDTDQWCEALLSAGVKGCILTAKHHDGFCLWDTAYTAHSSMHSFKPVDVVASLASSCRRYGLKLGLYLSPWDRHEPSYGSGADYDAFFCGQLEELTTRYGELYTLWFDGACGEGPNGKAQAYDWERYYAVIRKNQPMAVISVMGPDVRWIGNEAGETRPSEWSVVSARLRDRAAIAARSQQAEDLPPMDPMDGDLGSEALLAGEPDLCWYPAEVDVSIRPGWFYHPEENDKLRSVDDLLRIYEASAGGNAVLLLNVPPDTQGRIHPTDGVRLQELGEKLRRIYGHNLCSDAIVKDDADQNAAQVLIDDEAFWQGRESRAGLTISFPSPRTIERVVLCEQVRESQRIAAFALSVLTGGEEHIIYEGTTVGFQKICAFQPTQAEGLRITVTKSREYPTLRLVCGYGSGG